MYQSLYELNCEFENYGVKYWCKISLQGFLVEFSHLIILMLQIDFLQLNPMILSVF